MADNEPVGLDEFLSPPSASSEEPGTDREPAGLDSFIAPEMNEEKYGTPTEMAKTAAEGLAKGLAGPLATGAEKAIFGNEKEQLARAETNPVTHGLGEVTGLVGGSLVAPEVTLGGRLAAVGQAAKLGAEAAGIGKIGSGIVQHAIENMVFQAGDEASKMILKDPAQSSDTAITDMGLAALIGGGFGAISPLWHAASGKATGGILGALSDKVGGIEGAAPTPASEALAKSGMDIAPELKGLIHQNPAVQEMARTLMQTDTSASGRAIQKSYHEMTNQAGDSLVSALGKTPEEVRLMPELSKYESGKEIGNKLADEYENQLNPFAKGFDDIKGKLKDVDLEPVIPANVAAGIEAQPGTVNKIIDAISQKAIEEGWVTSPSSDIMREVNRVTKELPLQKNLKNLGDFITQVGNNTQKDPLNGPLRRAGGIMSSIMKDAEADVMAKSLGEAEGPAAVEQFKALREGYAVQSALKEALDSRLGARGSTSGYADAIREMARTDGEAVLRKLSGKGDAEWLDFVQKHYPETAKVIRDFHVNDLLQNAANKAKEGATIDNAALLRSMDKMSPELKSFVASPEARQQIESIGAALEAFKNPNHNFSNTARVASSLLKDLPATAIGAGTALMGHSFAKGALAAALAKAIGRDAPDAARLALLRFLGSSQPIDAGAFKTMVDYLHHTIKGETALSNAAKGVFKAGSEVIPPRLMPKDSDRSKIKRAVSSMQVDPEKALDMTGKTGYYLPNHATALSNTGATALQILNAARPQTDKAAPLDTQRKPSPMEEAKYNRTLDIAQQPLMVFKHLAEGTLTPGDVALMKSLYPALYTRSVEKLSNQMTEAVSKKVQIPYKTKLGLSLFMGQPLDSTMSPINILAAQPKPPQYQPQTAQQPAQGPKHSTNSLSKMPSMYKTQAQSAEQNRTNSK